ncbi:probable basic-leucine zipper transcription factor E [Schistocerca gregaria]|uniref:probable basic-leucine zipper transcription factor E n=1 Tax=Schistocerca gregaria TaxID=7010 RepID=UPI00211E3E39|nr:probable basic-leucine zipper transcription factor E [Schistocerca gregaria]
MLNSKLDNTNSKMDDSRAELCQQIEQTQQQMDRSISKAVCDLKSEINSNTEQIAHTNQVLEEWRITFESNQKELSCRVDTVESKISVLETDLSNEISNNQSKLKKVVDFVNDENSQLRNEFDQTKRFFESEIESFKSDTDKKVTEICSRVGNVEKTVDRKFVEIQETMLQKGFSNSCNGVRGNFPIKTYPGDKNIHPKDFMQFCKEQFTSIITDSVKIKFVKKLLDGEALSWANQNCSAEMSFEDFEKCFLTKFWSETEQARIKSEFLNGPSYRESDGSMKAYSEKQLQKLVHLDKPFDELTQIDALKRRLPKRVQWGLVYGPDESIEQFLKYVDKLDRAFEQNNRFNDIVGSSHRGWEPNRGNNNNNSERRNFNNNRDNYNSNDRRNFGRNDQYFNSNREWENRNRSWGNDMREGNPRQGNDRHRPLND